MSVDRSNLLKNPVTPKVRKSHPIYEELKEVSL